MLNQAVGRIEAAQRIAGKEAYDTSLKVYDLYETAAKSGVPGASTAFEALGQRFKKSTGRKKETDLKKK